MQNGLSEYDLLMRRLMDKVQTTDSQPYEEQKEQASGNVVENLDAACNLEHSEEKGYRLVLRRMQCYIYRMKEVRVQNQYMQQEIGLIAAYLGEIAAYQHDCEKELCNLRQEVAGRSDSDYEKRIAELERYLAMERAYHLQDYLAAYETLHLSSQQPDQSELRHQDCNLASDLQATDRMHASRISELETTVSCQRSANSFLKRQIELRGKEIDELNDSNIQYQRTISRLTYELNYQKMDAKRFAKAYSGVKVETPSKQEIQPLEQAMYPLEEAMQLRISQLSDSVMQQEKLILEKNAYISQLCAVVEEKTDNCETLMQDCALLQREFFLLQNKRSASTSTLKAEDSLLDLRREGEMLRARVRRTEEKAAKRVYMLENQVASLKSTCAKSYAQVRYLLDYIEAASAGEVSIDTNYAAYQQGPETKQSSVRHECFTFQTADPIIYCVVVAPSRGQDGYSAKRGVSRSKRANPAGLDNYK